MMVFAAATMSLWSGHGSAQPYPAKPIRIITAEVGGGNDFTARLIAQGNAYRCFCTADELEAMRQRSVACACTAGATPAAKMPAMPVFLIRERRSMD